MNRPRRETLESSWEWLAFAARLPARAFTFKGISGGLLLATGRFIYTGASALNADASSHFFVVRDGQDNTGEIVCGLGVASNAYVTDRAGQPGTLVEKGLYLDLVGGPWTGSVYAAPLWHAWITPPGE